MFGYKYKEDALKWRALEKEKLQKEVDRKFEMTVEIFLKDGDTQYSTYERKGDCIDIGWDKTEWKLRLGREILERVYLSVKEEAGTKGLESDQGIFIPHSNIHHIRKMSIVEVQE